MMSIFVLFPQPGTHKIIFWWLNPCLSGVFLRGFGVCARDRGCPVAEGGWEEVMEEALLPPEGFGNLLRPQRQSQGQWDLKCMKTQGYENQMYGVRNWHFPFFLILRSLFNHNITLLSALCELKSRLSLATHCSASSSMKESIMHFIWICIITL